MNLKKGHIVQVKLDGIGSEQIGIRPCIVVQNNKGNYHSGTTIIVPLTSKKIKRLLPTQLCISKETLGDTFSDSICLVEQVRIIDKQRILKKIGELHKDQIGLLDKKLILSLGISSSA